MTNNEARYEMMKFFSSEISVSAEDFLQDTNKVYLADNSEPFFKMMCFGNAAVVRANKDICDWCKDFVSKHIGFRCFDGNQMSEICRELSKHGYTVSCGQGALADMSLKRESKNIPYDIRIIKKNEIIKFYDDEIDGKFYPIEGLWPMLPYSESTEYIAACYDNGKVIGFAIADKNNDKIYDVGYETLPEYQQKGIATALTIELTNLLLEANIIPYAGFAWSNVSSKNVLIKSGYIMGWSNMGASKIN